MSKTSLGQIWINEGLTSTIIEKPFELDYSRKFFVFDIVPMGAVRMSQSDRWKTNPSHSDPRKRQRPEVTRYFHFKDVVRDQSKELGYIQGDTLEIVFCVPMPKSWSLKKQKAMNKMPVKTRPDIDNYVKAFLDALLVEDNNIWSIKAEKRFAFGGSIIIYQ
jgi:Holliday junction resolvase RusA-like endonuclease